jgi:hypothetical protein
LTKAIREGVQVFSDDRQKFDRRNR